jgi:Tol biopolymer transport system component
LTARISTVWILVLASLVFAVPAQAAFPGANGKIAFTSDRNGTKDVWTMNADGTGQALIQSDGTEDFYDPYPAWSPSGQDIAFMHDYRPFNHQGNVFVMDASGGNLRQVTSGFEYDNSPTWAPDGTRIAYSTSGVLMITSFPSSGSPQTLASPGSSEYDWDPDWSPDGTLVAFTNFTGICGGHGGGCVQWANIQVVDPSTGQLRAVTTGQTFTNLDPSISPDGRTVVFSSDRAGGGRSDLYTVPISGGTPALLTDTPTLDEKEPVWSPDGRKIAFAGQAIAGAPFDVYSINADGSDLRQLTVAQGDDHQPSWQPIPQSYARPRGATPLRVSLIPSYKQCTAPDKTHGAPLSYPSCSIPLGATESPQLTIGTPDANGGAANMTGSILMKSVPGNPSTTADEADVKIDTSVTDVRCRAPLGASVCPSNNITAERDYSGELRVGFALRITDRDNTPNPGGPGPGTVQDFPYGFTVACQATADNTIGSTCALSTRADALMPGTVKEGERSIWALDKVDVYDGGADGDADTAPNARFLTQGIFVP